MAAIGPYKLASPPGLIQQEAGSAAPHKSDKEQVWLLKQFCHRAMTF